MPYSVIMENSNLQNCKKFYENTKFAKPHYDTIEFISLGVNPENALEIGCGAGRDSVYLIKNGWNVVGVDRENTENLIREKFSDEENKSFRFICADINEIFSNLSFDGADFDLILSNFTLPFCGINNFDNLWKSITVCIKTGGYFVGNFFGVNDSWAESAPLNNKNKAFFLTKDEVLNLFKESFEIVKFAEIEKDGLTGVGKMKHWHLFNVIARKL